MNKGFFILMKKAIATAFLTGIIVAIGSFGIVNAADNGKLKYQVVHTYDEMLEYLSGDEYSYIKNATRSRNVNEYWSFHADLVDGKGKVWFKLSLFFLLFSACNL